MDLNLSRTLFCLPRLIRYFQKERPDAVYSVMSHVNVITLVARLVSRVSTRVIVSEHNHYSAPCLHSHSLRAQIMKYTMHLCYPFAESIVTVSKGVANGLVEML